MSKHERISKFVETLESSACESYHPCYAGYFECFNAGAYYEAHDVLEHLWLECTDSSRLFHQGLIQIAGAFVHLKKQHERPWHPTDGRRLGPAVRLLLLAKKNLAPFAPIHLGLDVRETLILCGEWQERIEQSGFAINPWRPGKQPFLSPAGLSFPRQGEDLLG
jgi:hypothetical protein